MLGEISQSEKDKYHMISLICGIYEQNELTSKIEADLWTESRKTALGVEEVRWRLDRTKREKDSWT